MRKKTIFVLLALLLFAILFSTVFLRPRKADNGKPEEETQQAARVEVSTVSSLDSMETGFNTTATLKELEDVEVDPKVTGHVLKVYVKKGEKVRKGQLLVELDHSDQDAELASAEATLKVSIAEADQSKVELDDAEREYKRYKRLLTKGYATQQEMDAKDTDFKSAKAAYSAALAAVAQSRAGLASQKVTRSEYILRSPIDGTVMDDYDLVPGMLVSSDSTAIRVARVDKLRALVDIPENRFGSLHVGISARITCDSLEGMEFDGILTEIDPYVDSSTRTVGAEIIVDNESTGYRLKPGMFSRVFLIEASVENPLAIPEEAIRSDGTVLVVKDDMVHIVQIKRGISQSGCVEVLSGVKEGDLVVISGGKDLHDKDPIVIGTTQN